MAKHGKIDFKGVSNEVYTFDTYDFPGEWSAVGAVYIVTQRYPEGDGYTHRTIYIGQTEDLQDRFSEHDKQECFDKEKANCLCVHLEDDKETRLKIEDDLIKVKKRPCNDQS